MTSPPPTVPRPADGRRVSRRTPRRVVTTGRGRLRPVGRTSESMNVLIVTSEAPPIVSGISRCVDRLTGGLRERGHHVDVLSSVQIPRWSMGEYRISSLAAFWPSLARKLDSYDVVNLHGPVPTMSDVFLALSRRLTRSGPPIVYTHHSALEIRGAERLCAVYNAIHRRLSARADHILTTSSYYAQSEHVTGGAAVQVVPWGVDLRPAPHRSRTERAPLRVLFVGQMRSYKGVEWLLPAVAGRPGISLTLVGGGANLAEYQRLAARLGGDNITFLGHVSDEDLHREYDRSDVVVLPSVTRAEAFGLVVLEGMAAGCVPVVSDLPGVRDLVGDAGAVVPPRDTAALATVLTELSQDVLRLDRLGRAARRRAEGLTWDTCVDRYEDVLRVAAGRGGSSTPIAVPQQAGRVTAALAREASG